MAKSAKARLSEHIRHLLSGHASPRLLEKVAPELLQELKPGMKMPQVSELLAQKVLDLALDPCKANQWAVEMVFDRSEGRSVQGIPLREDGRVTEDKLNEYTTHHLNALANKFTARSEGENEDYQASEDPTTGRVAQDLDLPSNRVGGAQALTSEPPVAEGAEGEGG